MEKHSYVSCIKINGVPILPPMMTNDVKEEMAHYKQQAMVLEKRLAVTHNARPNNNTNAETIKKVFKDSHFEKKSCLDNDSRSSKSENVNFDDSPSVTTIIASPIRNIGFIKQKDLAVMSPYGRLEENHAWDTNLKTENEVVNKSGSGISDIHSKSGSKETESTKSSTIKGSTLETSKPQVPKTLNIVPLTLSNNSNCSVDAKHRESDSETSSDTPKLVRQGSYVLDNPSPLLLAHMQTELANSVSTPSSEYVPTPTTNITRRKEWNIAQAKMEWERQCKAKDVGCIDVSGGSSGHEKCCPSNTDRRIRKSVSLQAESEFSCGLHLPTRSVDCIQAMLVKEYIGRSNRKCHDQNYDDETHDERNGRLGEWNGSQCGNPSTLNFVEKLGGSLGNLNNVSVPPCERAVGEGSENVKMSNGFESLSKSSEAQDSTSKLRSFITSDKLLIVYKGIQEMHRKQMTELVSRQQQEQTLLQKEFEKQQLLLLTEIKKSFPEVSVPLIQENIPSSTLDKLLPDNECSVSVNLQRDDRPKRIPCLLDYINTEVNHCGPERYIVKRSEQNETLNDNSTIVVNNFLSATDEKKSWVNAENGDKLKDSNERNRLSVSRQLFPLDSKTIHVPVLDTTAYETKHMRAASVINAYARGYLVRRMMQTESVIALKNTYREALHCMLKLHVDAPLNRSEFNFLHRLQLQCDAASMNIVELFAQSPAKRMQVIAQDREIKRSRTERPNSARLYSFATQRTLARKRLKEMGDYQQSSLSRSYSARSRCQTWTSDVKEKLISPNVLHQGIKRSTSAGTVRKPWR